MNKKRTTFYSILFYSFLSFISCDFINVGVKSYFEYYTETAAVIKEENENSIGQSVEGIDCIESNEDKSLTLYLRNPQSFNLIFSYVFDSSDIAEAFPDSHAVVIFEQSSAKDIVTLTFDRDFLNSVDKGNVRKHDAEGNLTDEIVKDISGTIHIKEEELKREFESHHVSVMTNSAPPDIRGALVQRDKAYPVPSGESAQYVLCFNLKNLNGTVHEKDTKKISISAGGIVEHFLIDFSSGNLAITDSNGSSAGLNLTAANPGIYNLDGESSIFSAADGYTSLYYLTGINPDTGSAGASDILYTVSLSDDFGFSSSAKISNCSEKLRPPSINVTHEGTAYYADDVTGLYEITLDHSRECYHYTTSGEEAGEPLSTAPLIEYEVYNTAGTLVTNGKKAAPVKVSLEKGSYYVKAFARSAGYIDSDSLQTCAVSTDAFTVRRSANYYVSKTGSDGWNGSKNKPYRTIQWCLSKIQSAAQEDFIETGYSIILQSDITPGDNESDFSSNGEYLVCFNKGSLSQDIRYTVEGNGHTIDAQRSAESSGGVIKISGGITVTFNDLTVKGGYKNVGPGIVVDDTGTSLNFNSGSVTGCTGGDSAIGVYTNSTLNLGSLTGSVTISGNTEVETELPCAVYIDTNVTFNLYKAIIYDNYDPEGNQANLYLEGSGQLSDQSVINVMGALEGCKIGVYAACEPKAGQPVPFTSGYGYIVGSNEGKAPGLYFIGDRDGVSYNAQTGEAVLAKNGGGLNPVIDEEIKILADSMYVPFNTQKDIHISVIKTSGSEQTDVTADCSDTSFALYYYGDTLEKGTYYTTNGNTFTAKTALRTGEYVIFVSTRYNGRTYSAQLPLAVRGMEEVYVDQTRGNDSNDGSNEHPVKTLKGAIRLVNATESFGFYTICINGNISVGGTGTATLNSKVASLSILKSGTSATVTGGSSTILKVNEQVDVSIENVVFTTTGNANVIEFDSAKGQDSTLMLKGSALVGRIKLAKGNTIVINEAYPASSTVYVHPADDDTSDRIIIGGNITDEKLAAFVCSNDKWSIDREGRLAAPLKDAPDTVGDLVLKSGKAVAYENRAKINSTQRADAIAVIFYDHKDEYDGVNQKLGDRLLGVGIGSFDGHTERYSIGEGTAAANGWFKWIWANQSTPQWNGANHSRDGSGIGGDVDGSDNLAQIGAQMRAWGRTDDTGQWHYCAIQWAMYSYPNNRQYTGDWRNGWYLPTSGEYLVFWWNRNIVNSVLDYAAPATRRFNTGDWFWTASCPPESSGAADRDAIFFKWLDGKADWEDSFREHCVCAIRNFK